MPPHMGMPWPTGPWQHHTAPHAPSTWAHTAWTPPSASQAHLHNTVIPTLGGYMGLTPFAGDPIAHGMPPDMMSLMMLKTMTEKETLLASMLHSLTAHTHNHRYFHGFSFSPTLCRELTSVCLGIQDLMTDWHKGLGPGVAMHRTRSSVQALKRTFQTMAAYGGQGFSLGNINNLKLDTPSPQLPSTYNEFLDCLIRYDRTLTFLLTEHSNLTHVVRHTYMATVNDVRHTQNPNHWFYKKGPFILWSLVTLAQEFFSQSRTASNWHQLGPIQVTQSPQDTARDIVLHASASTPFTDLPPEFQQLAMLSPERQFGWQNATVPTTPAPAPAPPRQQPPMATPQAPTQPVAKVHPRPVKELQEFFTIVQSDKDIPDKSKRTAAILKAANLTMATTLQELGLTDQDCFNFHGRGICNAKTCRKDHNASKPAPSPTKAKAIHTKLLASLPTLKKGQK